MFTVSAGTLPLGEDRSLCFPDLLMQPQDRIALVGPNGAGKSTLLRNIRTQIHLPEHQIVWIPQEIRADDSASTLQEAKTLASEQLGCVMQWVSRLGSDPHLLLESLVPSPGEIRKLMLALRLADAPALVVMDEPTNHMDLPSIECLEAALHDYRGGLLLVSHDQRFLSALSNITWEIQPCRNRPEAQCLAVKHDSRSSLRSNDSIPS